MSHQAELRRLSRQYDAAIAAHDLQAMADLSVLMCEVEEAIAEEEGDAQDVLAEMFDPAWADDISV